MLTLYSEITIVIKLVYNCRMINCVPILDINIKKTVVYILLNGDMQ